MEMRLRRIIKGGLEVVPDQDDELSDVCSRGLYLISMTKGSTKIWDKCECKATALVSKNILIQKRATCPPVLSSSLRSNLSR